MIITIRNILAYFLLSISLIFLIKILPSAIHEMLMQLKINTKIGIDGTNCQTIFDSIIKAGFEYRLFKVCLISFFLSLILLLRTRSYKLSLIPKNYNIIFLICFFIFLFINFCNFYAVYEFLTSNTANINVLHQHIIFSITFVLSFFVFILFSTIYILIWFDNKLNIKYKTIILILITCFSFTICTSIMTFNLMWGFVDDTTMFPLFDNILSNLGLTIFCMEETDPCKQQEILMKQKCGTAKNAAFIPKMPGGPPLY